MIYLSENWSKSHMRSTGCDIWILDIRIRIRKKTYFLIWGSCNIKLSPLATLKEETLSQTTEALPKLSIRAEWRHLNLIRLSVCFPLCCSTSYQLFICLLNSSFSSHWHSLCWHPQRGCLQSPLIKLGHHNESRTATSMHVNLLKRHHDREFSTCFTNLTNVNFSKYENRRRNGKILLLPNSKEQNPKK